MAAAAGSGDAWRISGEDRVKHDSQFFSLKPVNGFVTGEQARGFFMQSGLPTPVLGQIWGLADMNNDGKMDKKEFSIAMHLIKKKLQGYELPKSLPASMKADPAPMVGSFGAMPAQPAMMGMNPGMGMPGMMPGMVPRMPMMANGMPQMGPPAGFMGGVPVSSYSGGMPVRPAVPQQGAPAGGANLAMSHQSKLKYTQMFNTHDRNKKGSLTGVEARAILVQTGVPQHLLAQIWNLSDIDKDGKLNCDEFCIALHLTDVVKMGVMLPAKLPAELMPGKTRTDSFGSTGMPTSNPGPVKDSFGDLAATMGMPAPAQPAPVTNGESKADFDMSQVTFEDRRKENFDKGQAELERRRLALQDQLRRENEARMEKERAEQEKREKHRLEQERKKQQELERQLEKQREIERQREEQRQKMMEQREAARRELERQRQMEWERQRKEQLMAEKSREYEQLSAIKSRSSNLNCELESLQGKKTEISTKISQVKNGVTDFTAHIEAMRSTRDLKNKDIERLQQEIKEVKQRLSTLQADRETLDLRVQTTVQANPMSETHRTMMHSVELKKTSVQKLKKDLEVIEKDTSSKLAEIDILNQQVKEQNVLLTQASADMSKAEKQRQSDSAAERAEKERLQKEKDKHEALRKELEAQRLKEESSTKSKAPAPAPPKPAPNTSSADGNWFNFGSAGTTTSTATTGGDNWASVFDSQPATQGSNDGWSAAFSSQTSNTTAAETSNFKLSGSTQKYKALYQFDARNPDELTLMPGDTVNVYEDQTGAEPGWRGGEISGRHGWFPEAYVEKLPATTNDDSSHVTPQVSSAASNTSDFGAGFGSLSSGVASSTGIQSSEDSSFMTVQAKLPTVSPTPGQGQAAPDGLQAEALYPWKAKKDNHLTFNKGDIIHVTEQQDMWWSGEVGGKTGWFPKSYVKLVGGRVSTPVKTDSPVPPSIVTEEQSSVPTTAQADQGELYVGLFNYSSHEPGDLNFNQGEVITVTKKEGDWWTGTMTDGRTGIFPANYVKVQEQQPAAMAPVAQSTTPVPMVQSPPATQQQLQTNAEPSSTTNMSFDLTSPFPEDPFSNTSSAQMTDDPFGQFDPMSSGDDPFGQSSSNNPINDSFGQSSSCQTDTKTSDDPFAQFGQTDFKLMANNPVGQASSGQTDSNSSDDPFGQFDSMASFGDLSTSQSNSKEYNDPFGGVDFGSSKETVEKQSSDTVAKADINETIAGDLFSKSDFVPVISDSLETNANKSGAASSENQNAMADTFTEDPFAESFNHSPFPEDPFKAENQEPDTLKAFSEDPFKAENQEPDTLKAFSEDPFKESVNQSPFPDDAFKSESNFGDISKNSSGDLVGVDPFGNSVASDTGSLVTAEGSSTGAQKNDDKADSKPVSSGFDEFDMFTGGSGNKNSEQDKISASGSVQELASQTGNFPDQSTDWFQSVEKDAESSLTHGFGSLVKKNKDSLTQSPSNLETPSQTSGSPMNLDSLGDLGDLGSAESEQGSMTLENLESTETKVGSTDLAAFGDLSNTSLATSTPYELFTKDTFADNLGQTTDEGMVEPQNEAPANPNSPTRLPPLPRKKSRGQSLSKTGLDPTQSAVEDVTEDQQRPSSAQGQTGTLKKPEIATVIAAYTATGQEQLSLSPGQLIQVRKKSPSGWWEGELQARGQKRKIGWFPANYVKLLGAGSARSTPDNTLNTHGKMSPALGQMGGSSSANPSPAPPSSSTSQPVATSYADHVIALYPYTAQHADELTFQKDAVINVIKKDDPDWWQGEYNGATGMFPSNYVQSTTPADSNSWSADPQVLAVTSAEESRRQSYIHELINTEETYMHDMSIVLEAFYKPLKESGALTEEHLQAIFVNWTDLIVCNTKLQKALRVRKKMCGVGQVINSIGDILCENIPHLTAYIRFCSCQLNAAALLQKLTENNQKFNEIHKKCVQNPKTKGMPLSSFLLKPMQRITKYPLLVEKIIKHTPETHPDHSHLLDALEACQELCSQVNEGVREKESSDRLEWIQQRVHCEGLPEKITFNSVTNCLGPRKLVHSGVVYKAKSNKELAAFLFNDFLLLTTSNRSLAASHSVFDLTGQVQYKMYRTPVFLNEVMIRDSSNEDPESFTVNHIDRVYNLRCHSKQDRDNWVRRLRDASKNYLDTEKKKREKAISSPKHSRGVGRLLVIIIEGSNLASSKDVRHTSGMGRLLVVILEGIDLQPSDANGKSDPYCEVSMGAQEHKTKVINATLNPKWNASMQFTIRDVNMDALCITVFDRDLFSPNDFLGRTEIQVKDILKETKTAQGRRPIVKNLLLHEVATGEVVVKLDLHLYDQS